MEVKMMNILRETLTSYLKAQKNIRDEETKVGWTGGNQWCWAYALRCRKRAKEEIKESGRMKESHVKMHQRRLTKS